MKFQKIVKRAAVVFLSVSIMGTSGGYVMEQQEGVIVAEAAEDAFEQSISGFPESYKPYLRQLHSKYPAWKFEPYNVGVDFETVVDNEMDPLKSGSGNKSLVAKSADDILKRNTSADYNPDTGAYIYKDSSSWVSAARITVAWFLDPRNFLNEVNVLQFEKNTYDPSVHTLEGVKSILSTSFMSYDKGQFQYINTSGKTVNSGTTYAEQFYQAGVNYGVSPYYLASKSYQELGVTGSGSCSGKYKNFTGYYNFYNIGANDGADPISNGLTFASGSGKGLTTFQRPWTSPMKAISGGAQYFSENYMKQKQNTGYFVRFNVASDTNKYSHQFMTNISGACQETATTYSAYNKMGALADAKVFLIPVYENMPNLSNTINITSAQGKNGSADISLNIRSGPGLAYDTIGTLSKGQSVSILEGVRANDGYSYNNLKYPYWYKIKATIDGKEVTGYVCATSIDVSTTRTIATKQDYKLPVKLSDTSDAVYYHSDNPAVATVDANGTVTGKKKGKVTIYAFLANGKMDSIKLKVDDVALNYSSKTIYVKNYAQLKASLSSENKTVTWKSADPDIVTVNENGKVYGKAVGETKVTATTSDGASKSCEVAVKPLKSTIKVSSYNYNQITLSWTKSSYSGGYVLYRKDSQSGSYKKIATIKNRNRLSYKDTKVINGKTYTYMIRAYKKVGNKNYYSGNTTVKGQAKVAFPKMTYGKAKGKKITVKWSKVSGATGYVLYRRTGENGNWVKVKALKGNGKISFTNSVKSKNTYYYRVRAYRKNGKKNIYGNYSTIRKVNM